MKKSLSVWQSWDLRCILPEMGAGKLKSLAAGDEHFFHVIRSHCSLKVSKGDGFQVTVCVLGKAVLGSGHDFQCTGIPEPHSCCSWASPYEGFPRLGHKYHFLSWSCPGGHSNLHAVPPHPPVDKSGVKGNVMKDRSPSGRCLFFSFLLNKPISSLYRVPSNVLRALQILTPLILTVTQLIWRLWFQALSWTFGSLWAEGTCHCPWDTVKD